MCFCVGGFFPLQLERQLRLEQIAASVPYKEALDGIVVCDPPHALFPSMHALEAVCMCFPQADPERTRAHTFASQAAAELGISHAGPRRGGVGLWVCVVVYLCVCLYASLCM